MERVARALSPSGLAVVAVAQSNAADTAAFVSRHGLSFTTVLDVELDVSDTYGFDAVPALVLTGSDAVVLATMEGWSKSEFREMAALAAERCGSAPPAIELDGETLPEMRPGCASRVHDPRRRPAGSPCGAATNSWPHAASASRSPPGRTSSTFCSSGG